MEQSKNGTRECDIYIFGFSNCGLNKRFSMQLIPPLSPLLAY